MNANRLQTGCGVDCSVITRVLAQTSMSVTLMTHTHTHTRIENAKHKKWWRSFKICGRKFLKLPPRVSIAPFPKCAFIQAQLKPADVFLCRPCDRGCIQRRPVDTSDAKYPTLHFSSRSRHNGGGEKSKGEHSNCAVVSELSCDAIKHTTTLLLQ